MSERQTESDFSTLLTTLLITINKQKKPEGTISGTLCGCFIDVILVMTTNKRCADQSAIFADADQLTEVILSYYIVNNILFYNQYFLFF